MPVWFSFALLCYIVFNVLINNLTMFFRVSLKIYLLPKGVIQQIWSWFLTTNVMGCNNVCILTRNWIWYVLELIKPLFLSLLKSLILWLSYACVPLNRGCWKNNYSLSYLQMLMLMHEMHERVAREAGQLHNVLVFVCFFGCCFFFFDSCQNSQHGLLSWEPRFWNVAEYLTTFSWEVEGETVAEEF